MKTTIAFIFCWVSLSLIAQTPKKQEKTPLKALKSTQKLANYLTAGLSDDSLKAVAIYTWVTTNIAYDYDALKSTKPLSFTTSKEILKSKKTLCQGYSMLLVDLFEHAGIRAATIEGYTQSYQTDSLQYFYESDHEWVVFSLRNKWYLCDPTWDSGYIGRIPKKHTAQQKREKTEKRREKRLKRIHREKRKTRLITKWEKKDKETTNEELDEEDALSNKIGYVRNPSLNYFMKDPDDFLINHLPTLPAFQLREYPVSVQDYLQNKRNLDSVLAKTTGDRIDYNAYADHYVSLPLHEQWLLSADDGVHYNPNNIAGQVVNYHNYIGVYLNRSFRKQFASIHAKDLTKNLTEIRDLNDSVLVYVKQAQKLEKVSNSIAKRYIGSQSKVFKTLDKQAANVARKALTAQEKNLDELKQYKTKIGNKLETIAEMKEKITDNYSGAASPKELQAGVIPDAFTPWKDSLFAVLLQLDTLRQKWDVLTHTDTIYNKRFESLKAAYQQSYFNLYVLGNSPVYYDDSVAINDSLIAVNLTDLVDYHKNSVPQMLYPDEALKYYKTIEKMIKAGTTRMKNYAQTTTSWKYNPAHAYLQSLLYQLLTTIEKDYMTASNDRRVLQELENHYQKYYAIIEDNLKKEKAYKADNTEYDLKILKRNGERNKRMFELLYKNGTTTKKKLNQILERK